MTTKKKPAGKKASTAAPAVGIEFVSITDLKPNPGNPRVVRDEKFLKLVASIEQFPDMLNKRPLVVVEDTDGLLMVLGGNQRFRACQHLGLKTVPVIRADSWTEEQRREFVIKDNASAGEWDFELLSAGFDPRMLIDSGFDPKDLLLGGFDLPEDLRPTTDHDDRTKEIDPRDMDESMKLVLRFLPERYDAVLSRLRDHGNTPEEGLLNVLGLSDE